MVGAGGPVEGVEIEMDRALPGGQIVTACRIGDDHGGSGCLEDAGHALSRVGRVDRHVDSTGFHHGKRHDRQARIAPDDHGDRPSPGSAKRQQVKCQPVRQPVQPVETEGRLAVDDGGRIRPRGNLAGKQRRDRQGLDCAMRALPSESRAVCSVGETIGRRRNGMSGAFRACVSSVV